ncbi:MAG: hypothetical protein Tsb0014_46240 [Pleurocapsa sp.]
MLKHHSFSFWIVLIALSTVITDLFAFPISAQISPDNSLGDESSVVTPNVRVKDSVADLIKGGAIRGNNLFHSFEQFNVGNNAAVYFANPDGIANILTRVTGNNISEIFGTLGVDGAANLFLLNPNGIVFGENAALDVNGSFFATTAESFVFENGFEYSASNSNTPPLLTINIPVGVQFGNQAQPIEVQGTGNNLSLVPQTFLPIRDLRPRGLEVPSGKTLALIGGEINLQGGNITAPGGRIELGSVSQNSNVALISTNDGFSFSYQQVNNFQDINLTDSASIDVSGNGSGNIQMQGNNISLGNSSAIIANTIGNDNGGKININATNSLEILDGDANPFISSIINTVEPTGTGKGGNLTIATDNLLIKDLGLVATGSFGVGDSGNILIDASNIEITGFSPMNGYSSTLSTATLGTGKGGNLTIKTDNLSITEGGEIISGSFGAGDSGNILIDASNIEIDGLSSAKYFNTGISTSVSLPEASGRGGNLNINTDTLIVQNGSQLVSATMGIGDAGNININTKELLLRDVALISSFSWGIGNAGDINVNTQQLKLGSGLSQITTLTRATGNAGNLNVTATESIEISGAGLIPNFLPEIQEEFILFSSGLLTTVESGTGNGGSLTVETPSLKLSEGGQILTSTSGAGHGGDLLIRAENIEVKDTIINQLGTRSGISSSVEKFGSNHGGDIEIVTNNLDLIDGGSIAANALGQGDAGNIEINAQNINVAGVSSGKPVFDVQQPQLSSSISALSQGDFAAGSITISTDTLNLSDRATISVSNLSNGNSGNLNITTTELNLDNSASLEAEVSAGSQGNINLATDNIFLRNNSEITAQATDTATGGNISINNTDNIVLLDNSKIIADAVEGNGGNINITTQGLFRSPDSLISASSELGLDGNIEIEEINGDRNLELDRLPEKIVETTNLITPSCSANDNNAIAVIGNGGVPNSPYSTQSLSSTWYDLRPVKQEKSEIAGLPRPLQEASATIINSDGELELVALTFLSSDRWVKSNCGN